MLSFAWTLIIRMIGEKLNPLPLPAARLPKRNSRASIVGRRRVASEILLAGLSLGREWKQIAFRSVCNWRALLEWGAEWRAASGERRKASAGAEEQRREREEKRGEEGKRADLLQFVCVARGNSQPTTRAKNIKCFVVRLLT